MSKKVNFPFFKKHNVAILVFVIVSVFSVCSFFSLLDKFDYRIYDLMLGAKKEASVSDDILFVEIDDASIETSGEWPWPRDVIAEGLFRMKEMGANLALFDIEYLSPSSFGVNPDAKLSLASAFSEQKNNVNGLISDLSRAATSGAYSKQEIKDFAVQVVDDYINPGLDSLREIVESNVYRDNDAFFSNALQFFGNSWLTINTSNIEMKFDEEYEKYVSDRCLYGNINDKKGLILKGNLETAREQDNTLGFTPAMQMFIEKSKGAGFTNVIIDNDGTRRRVELLHFHDGKYIAQLAFSPLLNILDPEEIIRKPRSLVLKNCIDLSDVSRNRVTILDRGTLPRKDIVIPLDKHGRMLINWLHRIFKESFRHESFSFLTELNEIENEIVDKIRNLSEFKLDSKNGRDFRYVSECRSLLEDYEDITRAKNYLLSLCQGYDENNAVIDFGISEEEYQQYFEMRKNFFAKVKEFAEGECLGEIISRLDELRPKLGEEYYLANVADLTGFFEDLRNENNVYMINFEDMKKVYEGSFCILGNTASSTSDLGTTPFQRSYPNVGTHANVYNTIVNEDFIRPLPWFITVVFSTVMVMIFVWISKKRGAFGQNFLGIMMIFVTIAAPVMVFTFFGIYIPIVASSLIAFFAYIGITILRFVSSEKDKGMLRQAFSTYVAPAVVDQIVKDPSLLKLGGEEKHITALFTDIKSFSSFSELVTPTKLVAILNEYLGTLSDEILKNRGTIDKYIGDAIVSFFGAPLEMKDHAFAAVTAAIRMKQIESKFNEEHLKDGSIPRELLTRIGINTGDMVAGNMGTTNKMNYTIMGNDVNLASRLEGVNKTYHSWILCSETTWNEADSGEHRGLILGRKFDKVRVVGIEKPVQLYNILGFKNEADPALIEAVDIFHEALELYLKKDFKDAGKLFMEANNKYPQDESALVFANRCKDFIVKGVPENWDGVVNMTSK